MSDDVSSLITINEATIQELLVLSHIGSKRAERIVSYGQNVEPIGYERMLPIASGLGRNQIKSLLSSIDWRRPKTSIKDKGVPIFIYVLLIVGIISRLPEFSLSELTSSTFKNMVSLMIAGLAILLSSILVEAGFSKPILASKLSLESKLRLAGYLMFSTTLIGFGLLLITSSLSGQPRAQLLQVIQLIGWASMILSIILGPALHVWLISKNGDVTSKRMSSKNPRLSTNDPFVNRYSLYIFFSHQ